MKRSVVHYCSGSHSAREGTAFPRCSTCLVCPRHRSGECAQSSVCVCLVCVCNACAHGCAYACILERMLGVFVSVRASLFLYPRAFACACCIRIPARIRGCLHGRAYERFSICVCLCVRERCTREVRRLSQKLVRVNVRFMSVCVRFVFACAHVCPRERDAIWRIK